MKPRRLVAIAHLRTLVASFAASLMHSGMLFAAPPPILLANVLGPRVDVKQYFVSEKCDGVRAIWDGTTLRFRSGRTVSAAALFVAKAPPEALGGEL